MTPKEHEIVDWNGHFRSGNPTARERVDLGSEIQNGLLAELLAKRGLQDDRPSDLLDCGFCPTCLGQLSFAAWNDGKVRFSGPPCPYPKDYVFEMELNVPSGKIVVGNLDWVFPGHYSSDLPYYEGYGFDIMKAMIEEGLANCFLGRKSRGVYVRNGTIRITSSRAMIKSWGMLTIYPLDEADQFIGFADFNEYSRRVKHFAPHEDPSEDQTIRVTPGVYRFRLVKHPLLWGDRKGNHVFWQIDRVREAEREKNYLERYLSDGPSDMEIVMQQALNTDRILNPSNAFWVNPKTPKQIWEGLTHQEKLGIIGRAALNLLSESPINIEWNEKGFPILDVGEEAKKMAEEFTNPPEFNFQNQWGWKFFDDIDFETWDLRDGFVRLAKNICQSVIRFGGVRSIYGKAPSKSKARAVLKQLERIYP